VLSRDLDIHLRGEPLEKQIAKSSSELALLLQFFASQKDS
jgi:hypothetical protein